MAPLAWAPQTAGHAVRVASQINPRSFTAADPYATGLTGMAIGDISEGEARRGHAQLRHPIVAEEDAKPASATYDVTEAPLSSLAEWRLDDRLAHTADRSSP